jgi:multicomponent Na+:H+ antiporter subunit F
MSMYAVAMVAIALTMALALCRAALGPTVFDRILAANLFGTKTILLIAVSGFWRGRPDFLDLALVYALVNFTSTIVVLRFVRFGDFAHGEHGDPVADAGSEPDRAARAATRAGPTEGA